LVGPARARPPSTAAVPEIFAAITHLREVLGDQTYESLARKGETMITTAMATYAYDQIDQARPLGSPVRASPTSARGMLADRRRRAVGMINPTQSLADCLGVD
jgi:hypothetical protein